VVAICAVYAELIAGRTLSFSARQKRGMSLIVRILAFMY
jgi:hypothetical protein